MGRKGPAATMPDRERGKSSSPLAKDQVTEEAQVSEQSARSRGGAEEPSRWAHCLNLVTWRALARYSFPIEPGVG